MSIRSDFAHSDTPYERQWQITLKAAEIFKRDFPSGSLRTPLPQFRSSASDPVRDHYEQLAVSELNS